MKSEDILDHLVILHGLVTPFTDGTFKTEGGFSPLFKTALTGWHIPNDAFIELAGERELKHSFRNCSTYPHELSFEFNGVNFHAIFSDEEFKKLF